jgi:cysteine desulfurase
LSNLFWSNLIEKYPQALLNGSKNNRHPGNLNIQFPGIDAHSLLQSLQPNVAASTGSACNTGNIEPSYVLKAIGLSENSASSSIRFSFGKQNSNGQIIQAVDQIVNAIKLQNDF